MTRLSPLPVEEWDDDGPRRAAHLPPPAGALPVGPPTRCRCRRRSASSPITSRSARRGCRSTRCSSRRRRIDAPLRELIILRVAWRTRSTYEWAQHTRIGLQAGLTVEQLHAVPEGAGAEVWSPVERAVLAATDQMVDRHASTNATWNELGEHFDDTQLLELLFVAGAYLCFAVIVNSARMQPDPPTEPVDAPVLPGAED